MLAAFAFWEIEEKWHEGKFTTTRTFEVGSRVHAILCLEGHSFCWIHLFGLCSSRLLYCLALHLHNTVTRQGTCPESLARKHHQQQRRKATEAPRRRGAPPPVPLTTLGTFLPRALGGGQCQALSRTSSAGWPDLSRLKGRRGDASVFG